MGGGEASCLPTAGAKGGEGPGGEGPGKWHGPWVGLLGKQLTGLTSPVCPAAADGGGVPPRVRRSPRGDG